LAEPYRAFENMKQDKQISLLKLSDFHYNLPSTQIAQYPLEKRDEARLLVYQNGNIAHSQFKHLNEHLPANTLLVCNDTRVIQARLFFRRVTGARVEILLLHPETPREIHQAMVAKGHAEWTCMIGNKKRWKEGETLEIEGGTVDFRASFTNREENRVRFDWPADLTWAALLQQLGELPLPPYLGRKATEKDQRQYQTVYAKSEGAVAAPTAGLHFTPNVFKQLQAKGIEPTYLTLHVGAGTFQPVQTEEVAAHKMHEEQLHVSLEQLKTLRAKIENLVVVGTTSMRCLESLYWMGAKHLLENSWPDGPFSLDQYTPYQIAKSDHPAPADALDYLIQGLEERELDYIWGHTGIYMLPGYSFKLSRGLITNFHLPETTLMLLVAAYIGEDWRKVYDAALQEGYRFLSYGDSSLLWPMNVSNP
ncbi:MAG: S-adenosylmethionine:tRNA ribosyltransferase-isomerase, partial [Bacteroidota bacterium]